MSPQWLRGEWENRNGGIEKKHLMNFPIFTIVAGSKKTGVEAM